MSEQDAKLSQPQYTMRIEKDVRIPMRDGATLFADVFRPAESGRFPAILNISAYQKDKVWVPPDDLEEKANPYMTWETVNPTWWVAREAHPICTTRPHITSAG
jgi:predicted acyl esterase